MEDRVITQTEEYIEKALKQYTVTDAEIAKLNDKYMSLKINGQEDVKGYRVVRSARMEIKGKRIDVEKKRKELKEESLKFGKAVDGEAKRITALLLPIETHLTEQEKTIDDEKARIKREAAEKEQKRIQGRIQGLFDTGMAFNGTGYVYQDIIISPEQVNTMTDDEYHAKVNDVAEAKRVEASKLAEIERKKKEEEVRLAKQKAEQEAEQKRLEAENERIKKAQEKKEAELKAERDKLEAEKEAVEKVKQDAIDKKKHQEEIEKTKKEAEEKAVIEAKEKAKKEAEEKAEKERIAKMEAELVEKLRPDNEKLLLLADAIDVMQMPELANPQSHDILTKAQGHLQRATQILRTVQL